jgi:hypothetical protein
LVSRGSLPLKGKSEPVELFALKALDDVDRHRMAGFRRLLTGRQPIIAPK